MNDVIAQIDAEIAKLQQAKALLGGSTAAATATATATGTPVKTGRRGRPKGSKNAVSLVAPAKTAAKAKRKLSPEGRKAIADAMKRRWAERRKLPAK